VGFPAAFQLLGMESPFFPVGPLQPLWGASSHSLKYFYTAISEPSQGLPQFVTVGYLDGQVFVYYDSHTQKKQPRVSWIEKYVGKEDPQYWDRETQISRGNEEAFRVGLEVLRNRYNQSEGLHTLQRMFGCELRRDGSKGGFIQDGYNGRTFLTFDKETLTWVAPIPKAQITKRRWDADTVSNQRKKAYLEEICIEWLERYLSYGKETLLRTGEHLDPGWTFLLCGRISLTHSASLGPFSGSLSEQKIHPSGTDHLYQDV
uniref:MHC class I-like antigen recognition-like domain-containing protein n=1 Tax=Naja naja TaxID=35670 RepID=A0A8C7E3M7_NAJNA